MRKIELLAPAGSLDKAKIALRYGADAVYVGGKSFSLRARASNFSIEDLKELCLFASKLGKKVYVTMNIIPHDQDFNGLDEYLIELDRMGVTAIITSSLVIISRAFEVAPHLERHLSTQLSVTNNGAIEFYKKFGVSRVVLARENTLEEIKRIKNITDLELEVFIHGGMCSSYSGRCVLSNHYTNRDANRGGCAHSCRWNYHLYDGSKRLTKKNFFFNMGSKDLMAVEYVKDLIDIGVASLKIEGRMKSTFYLAEIISSYRKLIDLYYDKHYLDESDYDYFKREIKKAENRETSIGFLKGLTGINEQLYDTLDEQPTQTYIADVIEYNPLTNEAIIETRNYFEINEEVEILNPQHDNKSFIINKMIDCVTKEEILVSRRPLQKIIINMPYPVEYMDMIRKIK